MAEAARKFHRRYPVLAPLLLGLVLRLIHAGGRSLRFEEGLIARIVQEDIRGVIIASTQNSTPYIYNLLVHFFVSLFGSGPFVLTLVSIISGTLLIWVTYEFGKRYVSPKIALTAAYLVALSPFLIYYSQEVRPYSLLSLLAFCSAFFFLRALETNRFVYWALTVIFNVLAVYTQPIGWLYVFAEAVYFIIFFGRYKRSWLYWLVTTVIVGLYYIPQREFNKMLVNYMSWHLITPSGIPDFLVYTVRRFFGTVMHFGSGYYFYSISTDIFREPLQAVIFLLMAGVPALLLFLGLRYQWKNRSSVNLYLVLLFLAPVALIWMDGTSPRYYIMGTVPFLVICASGLQVLQGRSRLIAWAGVLLISAVACGDMYRSPTSVFSPENPRDLSRYLAQLKKPGDVVYYMGGINGTHTWKYYNPEPGSFIAGTPFWTPHFYGIRPSIHPDEYLQLDNFSLRIDPLLEKYDRVWLVMQGSRHRVIENGIEALKKYYDITLHYNRDWMALAEIRGKKQQGKNITKEDEGAGE